jgi:hypothetical protein
MWTVTNEKQRRKWYSKEMQNLNDICKKAITITIHFYNYMCIVQCILLNGHVHEEFCLSQKEKRNFGEKFSFVICM